MRMSVRSLGGDRLAVRIRGHEVIVDVPEEADGTDAGPTATELFVAGLAACVGYYAEMFLRRHALSTDEFELQCDFTMSSEGQPRVASIDLEVPVPEALDPSVHDALQRVLDHCSVHNSLRHPPEVRIRVVEPGPPDLRTGSD